MPKVFNCSHTNNNWLLWQKLRSGEVKKQRAVRSDLVIELRPHNVVLYLKGSLELYNHPLSEDQGLMEGRGRKRGKTWAKVGGILLL